MGRTENQKLKLLYLKELFERQSDEEHLLSMQDILDALAAQGIRAERKSVYDDILCLQQFGMDIVTVKGRNGGYFLASRTFELPELKLLVDAVQSSKFLSERKSMQLIAKLETLASGYAAGSLRRQVTVAGRVKTMNESVYYSVDLLHEAIQKNSRITFRYFDYDLNEYGKNVFGMFAGSREQLRLRFDRSLAGVVIDRFGRGTPCVPDGPDAFVCTVEVAVSPNFFGWLASFGARAQLLSPAPVREAFVALCRAAEAANT